MTPDDERDLTLGADIAHMDDSALAHATEQSAQNNTIEMNGLKSIHQSAAPDEVQPYAEMALPGRSINYIG